MSLALSAGPSQRCDPERITDDEIDAWLVDLDNGCMPTVEAFIAVCNRLTEAENERDELREQVNAYAAENGDLAETVRELS